VDKPTSADSRTDDRSHNRAIMDSIADTGTDDRADHSTNADADGVAHGGTDSCADAAPDVDAFDHTNDAQSNAGRCDGGPVSAYQCTDGTDCGTYQRTDGTDSGTDEYGCADECAVARTDVFSYDTHAANHYSNND
jgi:hypothetical protein